MRQHYHLRRIGAYVVVANQPPQRRARADQIQKFRCAADHRDAQIRVPVNEEAASTNAFHCFETRRASLPIEIVGNRRVIPDFALRTNRVDADEAIGIGIRKGADQNTMNGGKNRRIRTDRKRQGQHNGYGKTRTPGEDAARVAKILYQMLEPRPDPYRAGVLTGRYDVSHRAPARLYRFLVRHSGTFQFFLPHRPMKFHFFGKFPLGSFATGPVAEPLNESAHEYSLRRLKDLSDRGDPFLGRPQKSHPSICMPSP